jgi:hypothetical protein
MVELLNKLCFTLSWFDGNRHHRISDEMRRTEKKQSLLIGVGQSSGSIGFATDSMQLE